MRNHNHKRKSERKKFNVEMVIPCTAHRKAGSVGYTMSRRCALALLDTRKSSEKGMSAQQFLVSYINRTYDLLHYCNQVVLTDA